MLVSLPPDALEFRASVRTFLAGSLDDELKNASRLTTGVHTHIDAGQRWYKILSKQGWIAPTWPKEFGGTGWSALERYIFGIECFQHILNSLRIRSFWCDYFRISNSGRDNLIRHIRSNHWFGFDLYHRRFRVFYRLILTASS